MEENKISENIQEYLEVLYRNGSNGEKVSTTKLSKDLNIAPGSVTQMLKKLEELGYIEYIPYKGAILTDEGMTIAQKMTRKHRILEKFLTDVLKINEENVHKQACEMEHSLSDEAERALCLMLDQPSECPDFHVIPACNFDFENCIDCRNEKDFENITKRKFNLLALSEINQDFNGVITFIRGDIDVVNAVKKIGLDIGISLSSNGLINKNNKFITVSVADEIIDVPIKLANAIFILANLD